MLKDRVIIKISKQITIYPTRKRVDEAGGVEDFKSWWIKKREQSLKIW